MQSTARHPASSVDVLLLSLSLAARRLHTEPHLTRLFAPFWEAGGFSQHIIPVVEMPATGQMTPLADAHSLLSWFGSSEAWMGHSTSPEPDCCTYGRKSMLP